ncbi:MAG: response regulator [Pseudomonadota bacterium]
MHDLRALVVDDSKVGRLTMLKKLESMGMRVEMVDSGVQALEYLARERPDLVFMDHQMPDMDGFETTRRIKATPATRDIPVIIVSGNDEDEFVQEARQAGALAAVAKPPATEVLEHLLANLPAPVPEAVTAGPTASPVSAPAQPAFTLDEVRALVAGLLDDVAAQVRTEFAANLEALRGRQTDALAALEIRLQGLADQGTAQALLVQRMQALEAAAAAPGPDVKGLLADLEQRLEQRLEERLAAQTARLDGLDRPAVDLAPLAHQLDNLDLRLQAAEGMAARPFPDVEARVAALGEALTERLGAAQTQDPLPLIESLGESLSARLAEHAALMAARSEALEKRIEDSASTLDRLAGELGEVRSVVTERIGPLEEAIEAVLDKGPSLAAPSLAADAEDGLQSEILELCERLSEPNLRQLIAETVGTAPLPSTAPTGGSGPAPDVARLEEKLRRLTVLTMVGAGLFLGLLGLAVFLG